MKKIIPNIINKVLPKNKNQKFWEGIFKLSLSQMNYGNGGDFNQSGELNILNYIKEKLNVESFTIFDVGANVGNYSKCLAKVFGSNSKIYAFEPSKKTFEIYIDSTKELKNIIPNNFGFSNVENEQTLFSNSDGSGLASVYNRKLDHLGIPMEITENIKLRTIDSYCYENEIDRIHFLKLDIEGHELDALRGAKDMIENKKIDFIQFEFGGCNIDSRTYFQDFYYFLENNYEIYRILENDIYKLDSYKESQEIFLTINYLAIKK